MTISQSGLTLPTRTELDEEIERAREDAADSGRAAMNSYGAGYDAGFRDGLLRAKEILTTEEAS